MPTENTQKKLLYSAVITGESAWVRYRKTQQALKLAGLKLVSREIILDSLQM